MVRFRVTGPSAMASLLSRRRITEKSALPVPVIRHRRETVTNLSQCLLARYGALGGSIQMKRLAAVRAGPGRSAANGFDLGRSIGR